MSIQPQIIYIIDWYRYLQGRVKVLFLYVIKYNSTIHSSYIFLYCSFIILTSLKISIFIYHLWVSSKHEKKRLLLHVRIYLSYFLWIDIFSSLLKMHIVFILAINYLISSASRFSASCLSVHGYFSISIILNICNLHLLLFFV